MGLVLASALVIAIVGIQAVALAQVNLPQCADGVDNDADGGVDALVSGGDPNATFNIGGGNPFGGVRGFVNSHSADFGGFVIPSTAAVHNDAATALKLCQVAGYTSVVSTDCHAPAYGDRCGYDSFGDNQMYQWNGSTFVSIADNKWLSSVNCKGFAAACSDGKDNDGDGKKDFPADDGCASAEDASEQKHDPQCANAQGESEGGIGQLSIDETEPATVVPGSTAVFSFNLQNTGPDPATNVNTYFYFLNDNGTQYMPFQFSGSQGATCEIDTVYRGFTQVHCGFGTLQAGASRAYTLSFAVPDDATCDDTIPSTVDAWINGNPNDGSDSDNGSTVVDCDDNGNDPDPEACDAPHPVCGIDAPGGAAEQCDKNGKDVEWSDTDVCKTATGADGKCYKCVDRPGAGTCPAGFSCGVANGENAASCPDGQKVEWGTDGVLCGDNGGGRCFKCVDDNGDDDPPICPVGCAVDADCGSEMRCSKVQNPDGTKSNEDLCWKDDESNLCVKKCLIPRCVNNKCALAPPAEGTPGFPYVQCEGVNSCPAARCGDGVVQGGDEAPVAIPPADPGSGGATCNVTGTSCAQITDARACKEPYCVDVNGRKIQGTSCTCPTAQPPPQPRPPVQCDGYRGINGQPATSSSCAGGWWIRAADGICNCIMAALPGSSPTAPIASVLKAQAAGADAGEECDDGNAEANDGCSATCKKEMCGDGVLQVKGADGKPNTADDEECDDGNKTPGDGCSEKCAKQTCGDGHHDYGEECDDGDKNSDTESAACRKNCMLPKCNDGVIDVRPDDFGLDEQCDCGPDYADFDWVEANKPGSTLKPYCETVVDGHPALCHVGNCQAFYCGDGFTFNPGLDVESGTEDDEMCDNGPFNTDGLPEGDECENAAQCGGSPCVDGQCEVHSCSLDTDCIKGGTCIKNVCRDGGCNTKGDCKAGQTCSEDGNCSSCTVDTDCASGFCHPNALCAPVVPCEGDSCATFHPYTCRKDCKAARCGDGIVDKEAGETCDEGAAMMKCQGYPQPSCDCAVPTWGSQQGDGEDFAHSCCADGSLCSVVSSPTCPAGCGVKGDPVNGNCNNGRLDVGEECDVTDPLKIFLFRPIRDGRRLSFIEDNGKWKAVPASVEKKFTTIDHAPVEGTSPDRAWIRSQRNGQPVTYFHLWDVVATSGETTLITGRVGIDFSGNASNWAVLETPLRPFNNLPIPISDLNAAIVVLKGDEATHEITLSLWHSVTGRQLTTEGTITSPTLVSSTQAISIDALEIEVEASAATDPSSCVECIIQRCGNNVVEERLGESCDDGNAEGGDGCTDKCQEEICALP